MFSSPSSRAVVSDFVENQLEFPIAHVVFTEPLFLCNWASRASDETNAVGTFLCNKDQLRDYLLATDAPKLIALHVLVPSGPRNWSFRTALTVAHRLDDGTGSGELVFSDDLELFDVWSRRLPSSVILIPMWSAPLIAKEPG